MIRLGPLGLLLALCGLLVLPHVWAATSVLGQTPSHWSAARWDSAGLAPPPSEYKDAVVQVYAARAWGWRGIFAVHTWLVMKRPDAPAYERYEVVRWGVAGGQSAVRRDLRGAPDGYWAGNLPTVLADLRGPEVAEVIAKLDQAIAEYPYSETYRTWPGPNSNSFVAHLAREVPELRLHLPPTAVGKDYLTNGGVLARTPSGTGFQLSLFGLAGLTLAATEGLEVNLLGLTLGIEPLGLAVKLPGIGRLGLL